MTVSLKCDFGNRHTIFAEATIGSETNNIRGDDCLLVDSVLADVQFHLRFHIASESDPEFPAALHCGDSFSCSFWMRNVSSSWFFLVSHRRHHHHIRQNDRRQGSRIPLSMESSYSAARENERYDVEHSGGSCCCGEKARQHHRQR